MVEGKKYSENVQQGVIRNPNNWKKQSSIGNQLNEDKNLKNDFKLKRHCMIGLVFSLTAHELK